MQPLDVVNANQPVSKEQKMQFVLSSGDQLEETSICHAESTPMLCEGIKGMQTKSNSKKWFICDGSSKKELICSFEAGRLPK